MYTLMERKPPHDFCSGLCLDTFRAVNTPIVRNELRKCQPAPGVEVVGIILYQLLALHFRGLEKVVVERGSGGSPWEMSTVLRSLDGTKTAAQCPFAASIRVENSPKGATSPAKIAEKCRAC
jgi:hypothetical protein